MHKQSVVIAGASGFVGSGLVRTLASGRDRDVIALSRAERPDEDGVSWKTCDLFSLADTERALAGATHAFYLVHSMMPSARLTQGVFADFDLVCADNFARAAERAGISRVVYLGGLLPTEAPLSPHLQSRREVELTLASRAPKLTTLRAGLIIGPGGSSFRMVVRLADRLRFLVCPKWTRSLCQPIDRDDVVRLLVHTLSHDETAGQTYDIGGPDVLSYSDMLKKAADALGRPIRVVTVPFFSPRLSVYWVHAVTAAPSSLVGPLVESLRHDMVAHDGRVLQQSAGIPGKPFDESLREGIAAERSRLADPGRRRRHRAPARETGTARSVQRLPLPAGHDAEWVAHEYMHWLPRFFRAVIRVETTKERLCTFYLRGFKKPLLQLTFAEERSSEDRQLFFVTGGLLYRSENRARGRLEFRAVQGSRHVIAALHDFSPRLPWLVYSLSQAFVHGWVMRAFGKHLALLGRAGPNDRNGSA